MFIVGGGGIVGTCILIFCIFFHVRSCKCSMRFSRRKRIKCYVYTHACSSSACANRRRKKKIPGIAHIRPTNYDILLDQSYYVDSHSNKRLFNEWWFIYLYRLKWTSQERILPEDTFLIDVRHIEQHIKFFSRNICHFLSIPVQWNILENGNLLFEITMKSNAYHLSPGNCQDMTVMLTLIVYVFNDEWNIMCHFDQIPYGWRKRTIWSINGGFSACPSKRSDCMSSAFHGGNFD